MKLKLKEIAAISGKPGLFKIVKPTRTGVIVESLDEKKTKLSVGAAHRVSILKEVSIYTNDQEGAIPLEEVFHRIFEHFKGEVPFDGKTDKDELVSFMENILPDYDREKVYVSDMKKLVSWYNVIHHYSPITLEYLLREDELDNIPDPDPVEETEDDNGEEKVNPRLRTKSNRPKSAKKEKKNKKAPKKSKKQAAAEKKAEALQEAATSQEQSVTQEEEAVKKAEEVELSSVVTEHPETNGKPVDVSTQEENSEEELEDIMSIASELEQKFKVKRGSKKKRRKK